MTYPVVKDLARDGIPVMLSCRVLGFSRQAYYQWLAEPVSMREWSDAHAANAVLDAHADDPEFGYRFLADELRGRGLAVSDHQVLKACRLVRVRCCHSIRRGSGKGCARPPEVSGAHELDGDLLPARPGRRRRVVVRCEVPAEHAQPVLHLLVGRGSRVAGFSVRVSDTLETWPP